MSFKIREPFSNIRKFFKAVNLFQTHQPFWIHEIRKLFSNPRNPLFKFVFFKHAKISKSTNFFSIPQTSFETRVFFQNCMFLMCINEYRHAIKMCINEHRHAIKMCIKMFLMYTKNIDTKTFTLKIVNCVL